jgi:regulatory protein
MFKKKWRKPPAALTDEDPDKPKPPINAERARAKTMTRAFNILSVKAYSVADMRRRLLEKDWTTPEIVDAVLEKLKEYNYLNDEQFAKTFAASQIRQKPVGKRILKQKLAMKKLDKETVDDALEQVLEETPEAEIIERAISKRLRLKGKPETREDSKKFYDYLLRQGFSYDLVSNKMRELNSRALDEDE